MKNYEVYFPHNNANKIIDDLAYLGKRKESRAKSTFIMDKEELKRTLGIRIGRIMSKQIDFE